MYTRSTSYAFLVYLYTYTCVGAPVLAYTYASTCTCIYMCRCIMKNVDLFLIYMHTRVCMFMYIHTCVGVL